MLPNKSQKNLPQINLAVDGFNKMLTHIDAHVEPKYMMYVIIFMSIVMLVALVVATTHLLNKNCKELMNEEE